MRRRLTTHEGIELTLHEVDFQEYAEQTGEWIERQGGWRPHDPIVLVKRALIVVPKEKGMWN